MTEENAAEAIFLYEKLARDEDGKPLDTSSHETIPMLRQVAMAVDSMQYQLEFLMNQADPDSKVPHPERFQIHSETTS